MKTTLKLFPPWPAPLLHVYMLLSIRQMLLLIRWEPLSGEGLLGLKICPTLFLNSTSLTEIKCEMLIWCNDVFNLTTNFSQISSNWLKFQPHTVHPLAINIEMVRYKFTATSIRHNIMLLWLVKIYERNLG